MNIENPMKINFSISQDYTKDTYTVQMLILNYTAYLMDIAEKLEMDVSIATLMDYSEKLDVEENVLINKNFPLYHIKVKDEDELLGEFLFEEYQGNLYERFRAWAMTDILFYMRSKSLYREIDSKLPERQRLRQRFKETN